jgi:hypothetical protein
MTPLRRVVAVAALASLCCGCSGTPVFEDVGVDLHQPSLRVLAIAYQPKPDTDGNTPDPVFLPLEGFTVIPNDATTNTFLLQISYADAGADISTFGVRDRDSALNETKAPTAPRVDIDGDGDLETLEAPEFFLGTVGLALLEGIELSSAMGGAHRFEVWAEDSHGSRSEKVPFTVTVKF